ncbi:transmembrane protein 201 isoform X2 [Tachypleus tridentatus]|uniref:transmembrane protein 201 isoform X2 n=1 Tax=Tachypleus tridentatus TaxID=6853 RepID=UPI003FD27531
MDLYLYFGILVYVFFAIVLVYSKLRPKFPVRVYCWFCGEKHGVPFGNRNCWDCPHCDQYNGFSETGDYNKPIPAQYDEGLNFPVTGSVAEGYEEKYKQPLVNGLCKECNQNQTMKIRLLSDFVPLNKLCFNQEVEAYQSHLEKVYKLCWQCEVHVQKKLSQQDAELRPKIPPHLLYYRLNEHTKPVLKVLTRNEIPFGVHVLAAINFSSALLLLVSAIFELQEDRGCRIFPISWLMVSRLPTSSFLTVVGLLVAVGRTLWAGRQRLRTVDALCCALWVTLQGLYSSVVSGLFTEPDLHLLRLTVILVTAMVSFSSGIFRMPRMVNPKQKWLNKANQLTSSRRKIKVLNRSSSSCGHKSIDNLSQSFGTKQASQSFTNSSTCSFGTDRNITAHHSLHLELDALHITSPGSLASKLQVYSASPRPVGFSASKPQTSLVRPARFTAKSVTQASWVAGGYWSLPVPPVRMEHELGRGLHFNSSVPSGFGGLLTPPPSLSGSQESRAPSPSVYSLLI